MAEAVLTGIVDSLCELYERAPSQLPRLERVVVAGNFFQHHGWLKTRIAERWQVPVISPRYQEQAAAGAALLALEWTRTQA